MFGKLLGSITGSAWWGYIKLALLGAALAGSAYFAWTVRDATAKVEKIEAVDNAVKDAQKELDAERARRQHAEGVASEKLDALLILISKVGEDAGKIRSDIKVELERNKAFYQQQLPKEGYEQWKRARALSGASPASSPRP